MKNVTTKNGNTMISEAAYQQNPPFMRKEDTGKVSVNNDFSILLTNLATLSYWAARWKRYKSKQSLNVKELATRINEADVLVINGTISSDQEKQLCHIWNAMPEPKWVIKIEHCQQPDSKQQPLKLPIDLTLCDAFAQPEIFVSGLSKLCDEIKSQGLQLRAANIPH